jgi:hypothetical protein
MRFNSEKDAWNHWVAMYNFHGQDIPGGDVKNQMGVFRNWVEDQGISWLEDDMAAWLERENEY